MPPVLRLSRTVPLLTNWAKRMQRNYRRAERDALRTYVPHIDTEFDKALGVLDELEVRLPAIRTQTAHVRRLYDSSHDKARHYLWSFWIYLKSLICGTRL